jgi:hypothetical protein
MSGRAVEGEQECGQAPAGLVLAAAIEGVLQAGGRQAAQHGERSASRPSP